MNDLDFTPDPELTQRIREAIDRSKASTDAKPREGEIIDYQLWDEQRKPVIRDLTRDEMRKLHRECGGIRIKCTVTH